MRASRERISSRQSVNGRPTINDQESMSQFDMRQMVDRIFGEADDPISLVEQRAELVTKYRILVWEGDATTFEFRYVSPSAVDILGYPLERWTSEPTFWADVVVHPDDRDEAIAYCALATGQGKAHDFIYRAQPADGRILCLHDFVQVVPGRYDLPEFLRGIMIDVTDDETAALECGLIHTNPSFDTLRSAAG